jgi:hypothetical protein
VGRGHGEEPITRILKNNHSAFSVLFSVSVHQKMKSGRVNKIFITARIMLKPAVGGKYFRNRLMGNGLSEWTRFG